VSIASQPDERADAIEVYLRRPSKGTLARAVTPLDPAATGNVLQRVTSGALRGGLTTWVHVGMLVRRMRGRADPLQGLGQRDTFLALCRLAQAAVEGVPVQGHPAAAVEVNAHLRMFTTHYASDVALGRLQQVLQPYAAAGTVTRTGRAVIGWFAIRHLIATRSSAYSLQVVHLTPAGRGDCQVSLMLPRAPEELLPEGRAAEGTGVPVALAGGSSPQGGPGAPAEIGSRRQRRRAQRAAAASSRADGAAGAAGGRSRRAGARGAGGAAVRPIPLQAYLDAYREHLTRELLLEPVFAGGPVAGFAWTPEPTGDGGVAVGGTMPAAISDQVVLRMAALAVEQLGERSPESAGEMLGYPEPDGDLLVQRWAVGAARAYVLSVAARSGDRRRPTQVLIHLAAVDAAREEELDQEPVEEPLWSPAPVQPQPQYLEPQYQVPRSGPDVDDARGLLLLPLWWHSADARCDGNDVILYEMPFRGRRLRIRANDYPAEPMYTLLVGDPGAEIAAVDLEDWPIGWTRPRAY
jgi:hypothetical protein